MGLREAARPTEQFPAQVCTRRLQPAGSNKCDGDGDSRQRLASKGFRNSSDPRRNCSHHHARRGECAAGRNAKFHSDGQRQRKFSRDVECERSERRRGDERLAERDRSEHRDVHSAGHSAKRRRDGGRNKRGGSGEIRIGERDRLLPGSEFDYAGLGERHVERNTKSYVPGLLGNLGTFATGLKVAGRPLQLATQGGFALLGMGFAGGGTTVQLFHVDLVTPASPGHNGPGGRDLDAWYDGRWLNYQVPQN